jgi:integrase
MAIRIKPVGKGLFEVIIEAGRDPLTGKRKRIYRRVKGRQQDAEKLGADILYEIKRGTYLTPDKTPLRDYLSDWINTHESNIAPSTYAGYERIINRHIIPGLGQIPLSNLRAIQVQAYYTKKISEGLSQRTVRQHHSVLHKALSHAV